MQLVTDTTHGLVVNVEATTDAIDYRQLQPALDRCQQTLGRRPKQIVADGDYTNHASVQAAAACGVDFYGSWQDSWKPTECDAQGRSGAFIGSAFSYDPEHDVYLCPAGQRLTHHAILNREHGVRTHVYKAPKAACRCCAYRNQCASKKAPPDWRRSITRLEEPAVLPSRLRWTPKQQSESTVNGRRSQVARMPGSIVVDSGNFDAEENRRHRWKLVAVPQLQPHPLVQHTAQGRCRSGKGRLSGSLWAIWKPITQADAVLPLQGPYTVFTAAFRPARKN